MKIKEYWNCDNYQSATYGTLPWCSLKSKYASSVLCDNCKLKTFNKQTKDK